MGCRGVALAHVLTVMILSPGTYHCLSIWQPWSWAIFNAQKCIENRNWPVNYRGKLLIHASKQTREVEEVRRLLATDMQIKVPPIEQLAFGAILGVVDLWACKWSNVASPCGWGAPGCYHWHLRDQRLLDSPIPYRGAQGIFKVTIGSVVDLQPAQASFL